MADEDVLENLRDRPHWPRHGRIDHLAVKAAALGKLRGAYEKATALTWVAVKGSSNSSAAVSPELVPISEFSHQPNTMNAFHSHLMRELGLALGELVDVSSHGDD